MDLLIKGYSKPGTGAWRLRAIDANHLLFGCLLRSRDLRPLAV